MSQRLGDFEIVREIGRGGMGVVYEARQLSLNRKVALKVLSSGLGLTPQAVERFHREAEAAAKLHHTNIVPVYATGEQDGVHYYAMELIEGPSLDQVIARLRQAKGDAAPKAETPALTTAYVPGPDPSGPASGLTSSSSVGSGGAYFDTAARMIADVADALDYARRQGVIHRDVKPSNLLLGPDGRLSLNDFGLARVLEQPGMTQTGEFVGTPRYMSPEQITGGRVPVDHRTDVYSLGATLYELLTLQPPFTGERRDQVLAQVLQKEPRPPRRLNRSVPVDLETICLKALEKDPDRRYQTAGAMAEDLRRYVNRFAIAARRVGPVGKMRKWVRRHPGVAAMIGLAVILAAVAGVLGYQAYAGEQRRLAEKREADQKLLTEQRQNALDKALLIAMSGDLDAAEKAIEVAERLGASTGEVRMLRGELALHRGQSDEAVKHLQQAIALMPASVAARAMLGETYFNMGWHERGARVMKEVEGMTCVTPEDFLFKGYMQSWLDPAEALRSLDEAMRRRPSVIARAIRAEVRADRAMDTGDIADAELALQDADAARNMMPDNPETLGRSLFAHLVAAGDYEETMQEDKRQAALEQAARDAEGLKRFPLLPDAVNNRWEYFWYINDVDAVYPDLRLAAEGTDYPLLAYVYCLAAYSRGDFDKALEVMERLRGRTVFEDMWIFLLMDLPDGRARALEALKEASKREQAEYHRVNNWCLLRLVGGKAEAVEAGLEYRRHADEWPKLGRELTQGALDYNCDLISEGDLLRALAHSKDFQCAAHYTIGLRKLGEGDRDAARKHFQMSVATRAIYWWSWDMSKVLLARMDKDPAWPRWIPVEK